MKKIEKHLRKILNERISKNLDREAHFQFALNYIKQNIVNVYNEKFTANDVIKYWFLRGLAEKWKIDN